MTSDRLPSPREIHKTRRRLRYSLKLFAEALGYSKGYISNIERGQQAVTESFAKRFRSVSPLLNPRNGPEVIQLEVYRDKVGRFRKDHREPE